MDNRAPVLLFRSASRNFPTDLEPDLKAGGYTVTAITSLAEYVASPSRQRPQLVLLEIGSLAELDRAVAVIDWNEHVQPLAPTRYLLLLGSKNLSVGERAAKLAAAEIVALPQPARNLLFKLELQSRLLRAPAPARARPAEGFTAKVEEVPGGPGAPKRVLALRGPSPAQGSWRDAGNTPTGRIRWRWVKAPGAGGADSGFAWTAEGASSPRFEEKLGAWLLEGEGDRVLCQQGEQTIFAADARSCLSAEAETESPTEDSIEPRGETGWSAQGRLAGPGAEARPVDSAVEAEPPKNEETTARGTEESDGPAAEGAIVAVESLETGPAAGAEKTNVSSVRSPGPANAPTGGGSLTSPASALEKARAALARAAAASTTARKPQAGAAQPANPMAWSVHDTPAAKVDASPLELKSLAGRKPPATPEAPRGEERGVPAAKEPPPSRAPREPLAPRAARERPEPESSPPNEKHAPEPNSPPDSTAAYLQDATAAPEDLATRESWDPLPSLGEAVPDLSDLEPTPAWKKPVTSNAGFASAEEVPAQATARPEKPGRLPESPADLPRGAAPSSEAEGALAPAAAPDLSKDSPPPDGALDPISASKRRSHPPSAEPAAPGRERPPPSLSGPLDGLTSISERATTNRHPAPTRAGAGDSPAPTAPAEDARRFLKHRHFELMSLEQLGDRNSTWQPAGSFRIYLAASHRYYGLANPEAALPLWIYSGELAPEFIDDQKAWKFYDRLPVAITSVGTLPAEVLEALHLLCGLPVLESEAKPAAGPAVVILAGQSGASPGGKAKSMPVAGTESATGFLGKLVTAIRKLFGG